MSGIELWRASIPHTAAAAATATRHEAARWNVRWPPAGGCSVCVQRKERARALLPSLPPSWSESLARPAKQGQGKRERGLARASASSLAVPACRRDVLDSSPAERTSLKEEKRRAATAAAAPSFTQCKQRLFSLPLAHSLSHSLSLDRSPARSRPQLHLEGEAAQKPGNKIRPARVHNPGRADRQTIDKSGQSVTV